MTHRSHSDLPPKLLQGRQAFEQWRSQQETRCRLPDHLWSLAVELDREYGFTKTAKTLRVEYNMLKKKSRAIRHDIRMGNSFAQVVEVVRPERYK